MSRRVLLTNITLATQTGTEWYTVDLARALVERGHAVAVYTVEPGRLARELERSGIAVYNRLDDIDFEPDVIHGHHGPTCLAAMLRFPAVPGVFVCHDAVEWHDEAPLIERLRRYIAVDTPCRRRLERDGVPPRLIERIPNFVNLDRFKPRHPLPERPRRALVFSHYAREGPRLEAIRRACRRCDISLDVVGTGVGNPVQAPEEHLGRYDLVFAKAKAALEAMATGCAVILADHHGQGPLVTSDRFDALRPLNFGRECLTFGARSDELVAQIGRYDSADAAVVQRRVRREASLDDATTRWSALYERVMVEHRQAALPDAARESSQVARYLERINPRSPVWGVFELRHFQLAQQTAEMIARLEEKISSTEERLVRSRQETARARREISQLKASESYRLGKWILRPLRGLRAKPPDA